MDSVKAIAATLSRPQPARREPAPAERIEPAPGRALVALDTAPPRAAARRPPGRETNFLAHLIAVRDQAPQTRERRRAEPAEALSRYRAASATPPAATGTVLSRAT